MAKEIKILSNKEIKNELVKIVEKIETSDHEIFELFMIEDDYKTFSKKSKSNINNIKKILKVIENIKSKNKQIKNIIEKANDIIKANDEYDTYSSYDVVNLISIIKEYCNTESQQQLKFSYDFAPVVVNQQRNFITLNKTTIDILKDFESNCTINDIFASKNFKFEKKISNFGIYIIKVILCFYRQTQNAYVTLNDLKKQITQKGKNQNRNDIKLYKDIINVIENELSANTYKQYNDKGEEIGYGEICSISKAKNNYYIYVSKFFHELMQMFDNIKMSKTIYNKTNIPINKDVILMQDYLIEKLLNTRNKNIIKIDFEDVLKYCDDYSIKL